MQLFVIPATSNVVCGLPTFGYWVCVWQELGGGCTMHYGIAPRCSPPIRRIVIDDVEALHHGAAAIFVNACVHVAFTRLAATRFLGSQQWQWIKLTRAARTKGASTAAVVTYKGHEEMR